MKRVDEEFKRQNFGSSEKREFKFSDLIVEKWHLKRR